MYFYFGIFFLVLLFFFFLNHWRRKKIIKKVRNMCTEEKCDILNGLIEPFGYSYMVSQDLFTSRHDAWQREYGYCTLYDKAASRFSMIFDCLPIYFDYNEKTWLIELWKGQYGINTGAEIGMYYADRILEEKEYTTTLFHSVEDQDMPGFSFHLFRKGSRIADLSSKHWWLTAFSMGRFSEPVDLYMRAGVTLKDSHMLRAFTEGLIRAGYSPDDITVMCNTVTFSFTEPSTTHGPFSRFRRRIAQRINHFWCNAYMFVTKPFYLSLDRILYLYYYLPFIFRRMLRIRKYKKYKQKRR